MIYFEIDSGKPEREKEKKKEKEIEREEINSMHTKPETSLGI